MTSQQAFQNQLQQLAETALLLNQSRGLEKIGDVITRHAAEIIGANLCVTSLTIGDHFEQKILSFYHSPRYEAFHHYRQEAGKISGAGIYRLVCASNTPMRLTTEELHAHPGFKNFSAGGGKHPPLNGWLAAPLIHQNSTNLGLIQVSDKKEGEFTESDTAILMQLAQQASIALENARLLEEERRQRTHAETLSQITLALASRLDLDSLLGEILEQTSRLVPCTTINLAMLENGLLRTVKSFGYDRFDSDQFLKVTVLKLEEIPLEQQAILTNTPIVISDTLAHPQWRQFPGTAWVRSYIGLPIQVYDEPIGILRVDSDQPGQYEESHALRLRPLANAAALAISNARLFEQVHESRENLRRLTQRLLAVQESERSHLARELHDEVGQLLTGLKLCLEIETREKEKKISPTLLEAQALVSELMRRIRDISLDLRPSMLDDLGLLPALVWLIERFSNQTKIEITFEHAGIEGRRLPSQVESAGYRIVQEALTNIARHAQVSRAEVSVRCLDNQAHIQVRDAGVGFEPAQVLQEKLTGGLLGMRERATLIGGRLSIQSAPGRGTRLEAEIPLAGTLERRRFDDIHTFGRRS